MKRTVVCCDAFNGLAKTKPMLALVTSLPDASEIGYDVARYEDWFTQGALLCMRGVADKGVAIFYQGDRKHDGELLSKAALLCNAARSLNLRLLWHKIVIRNNVETINLYRPSYLHLMAFSKSLGSGKPTPDVLYNGKTLYNNGMGIIAAKTAVRFAIDTAKAKTIHDPFCGRGTVLAVANAYGCDSVGFDIDQEQCVYSRKLVLDLTQLK